MIAMISQPMNGLEDSEIYDKRNAMINKLKKLGYETENTFFNCYDSDYLGEHRIIQEPVFYLAKSLEKMAKCDAVCFCVGWDKARGCKIEREVAEKYGLSIIEELEDGSLNIKFD